MNDWLIPYIDQTRCTRCGLCIKTCPTSVVKLVNGRPVIVEPKRCSYCGACEDSCPEGAVELSYEIVWGDGPSAP